MGGSRGWVLLVGGLALGACADGAAPGAGPGLGTGVGSSDAGTTEARPSMDTSTSGPTPAASSDGAAMSADSSSGGAAGGTGDTAGDAVGDAVGDTTMPTDDSACPLGEDGCPCDAGECDFGLSCIEDVCGVPGGCSDDLHEPNETEATATALEGIEDCNSDGDMVAGVLSSDDDVDWYRYAGDDVFGCTVDPARSLASDGPVRFCKFVECNASLEDTDIGCPDGVTQSISPDGRPGCCSDAGFGFDNINCPGIDDDATVYLRVDQPAAECSAYTVSYHY